MLTRNCSVDEVWSEIARLASVRSHEIEAVVVYRYNLAARILSPTSSSLVIRIVSSGLVEGKRTYPGGTTIWEDKARCDTDRLLDKLNFDPTDRDRWEIIVHEGRDFCINTGKVIVFKEK